MTREQETADEPWKRTREDYIQILKEGQTESFGDYDNSEAWQNLLNDGTAEIDQSKGPSRADGMVCTVWMKLR